MQQEGSIRKAGKPLDIFALLWRRDRVSHYTSLRFPFHLVQIEGSLNRKRAFANIIDISRTLLTGEAGVAFIILVQKEIQ